MKPVVNVQQYLTPEQRKSFYGNKKSRWQDRLLEKILKAIVTQKAR